MKMKNILKTAAVLSAAAVMFSASGCADTTWSIKTDTSTLTNGNWIYYTYTSYNSAMSKIKEDSGESFDIKDKNLDDVKVEGKKIVDWISEDAKKSAIAQLTVEKLAADKKIEVDEEELNSIEEQYLYYYNMGQSFYEKLGVSSDTFANVEVKTQYLSDLIFKNIYGEGGEKEVTDDELKKYFTDNYTDYYYIAYPLTEMDDEGNTVDVSDETKDTITENFAKYAKILNDDGSDTAAVEEQFKTDFSTDTVTKSQNVTILDNAGLSEELAAAIKELDEKKAAVKTVDKTHYVIYKGSISEDADRISDDANDGDAISRNSILYSMKNDEYKEYLEAEQNKLKYETNDDCISRYSVQRTIDIIKADS